MHVHQHLGITALALGTALPFNTLAQTATPSQTSISVTAHQSCLILPREQCSAHNQALSLTMPSGSGTFQISLKRYDEKAFFLPYQQSWRLGRLGSIGAEIDWNTGIQGQAIALEKSFLLGNSRIALGAALGRIEGQINLHGSINAHRNAGTLSTPFGKVSWSDRDYLVYSKTEGYEGQTQFGLLRQNLNYGLPLSPQLQIAFSENAGLGTRTYYGVGAEISYASHNGEALHRYSPSLCESENALNTTAHFAVGIGVCATKITRDYLYDLELKQADKLARRLEGYNHKLQPAVDAYNKITRNDYQLQRHTAQSVLNFMGVENPYSRIHYSFNLRAQWRLHKDFAISADIRKPMRHSAQTGIGVHYSF